jgi:hypothetical protein
MQVGIKGGIKNFTCKKWSRRSRTPPGPLRTYCYLLRGGITYEYWTFNGRGFHQQDCNRTFALFSWLIALAAIIAASVILLRQQEK